VSRGSGTLLTVDGYSYLEHMVRYTGAIVALVASFVAAPGATRHVWSRLRLRAVTSGRTVERAWLKVLGRGPTPQSVTLAPATINVTASVIAVGIVTSTVDRSAPLTERVDRVEQHIETLNKLHDENKQAIAEEASKRQEAVRLLTDKIGREAAAIRSEIAAMEQTAMLVDARALPVIGFGIVLSSMSDLIAQFTVLSNVLFALAIAVLAGACDHFFASGPDGQVSGTRSWVAGRRARVPL
jgi:hypothetical protein